MADWGPEHCLGPLTPSAQGGYAGKPRRTRKAAPMPFSSPGGWMRIRQSSSRGWQGALHAGLFALALQLGGVTSFLQAGLACHRVQLTLPAQQRLQTLEQGLRCQ